MNQQMTPENPRKKIIWTIVIIALVLLAMGAIAWYFFLGPGKSKLTALTNKKANQTANWYKFESKTFGYTILYPKDWQYKNEGTKTSFSPKETTDTYLEVNVINDILTRIVEDRKKESFFKEQTTVTIDNQPWVKLTYNIKSIYLIERENQVYQMTDFGLGLPETVNNMVNSFKFENPSAANAQGEISFNVLAAGSISSETKLEAQNYTFKNNDDFKALWDKIYSLGNQERTLPTVDFNQDMVIAVVAVQAGNGGFEIEISKILEKQTNLEVIIKETSLAAGCPATQELNQPFEFIKINKTNKEIKFTPQPETKNC